MGAGYITAQQLQEAPTLGLVTGLGDAQGVDFSQWDVAVLQALIQRVSAQMDAYCRQTYQLTNTQERYMGRGTNELHLRCYPLTQIPDSVFGGTGNVSQSLAADTTYTAAVDAGATSVPVHDIAGLLPGQWLQWADGTGEGGQEITAVTPVTSGAVSGPGTLLLKGGLSQAHPLPPANGWPARVVVNTLDFVQIVLPGISFFPIPVSQLVVDAAKGLVLNYTPLLFQSLGYATIFPAELPLLVRYTYGFPVGQVPAVLQEVCTEWCRRTALLNANFAEAGLSQMRSGDASLGFQPWQKKEPLDADLAELLAPYRRGRGGFI